VTKIINGKKKSHCNSSRGLEDPPTGGGSSLINLVVDKIQGVERSQKDNKHIDSKNINHTIRHKFLKMNARGLNFIIIGL